MKRITSARRRIELRHSDSPVGDPIEFGIKHFMKVPRNIPVVLFCRVSTSPQDKNDNLKFQAKECQRIVEEHGNPIVNCYREVAAGWELVPQDRTGLMDAIKAAKESNAVIVAESLDRLIRNASYHPYKNPGACPTKAEFQKLMKMLQGVPVATICHPNASRYGKNGIRSIEIKRGQSLKNRRGGRPRKVRPGEKKQRRLETRPLAIAKRADGLSIRKIATELGIPKSTIARWLKDDQ